MCMDDPLFQVCMRAFHPIPLPPRHKPEGQGVPHACACARTHARACTHECHASMHIHACMHTCAMSARMRHSMHMPAWRAHVCAHVIARAHMHACMHAHMHVHLCLHGCTHTMTLVREYGICCGRVVVEPHARPRLVAAWFQLALCCSVHACQLAAAGAQADCLPNDT